MVILLRLRPDNYPRHSQQLNLCFYWLICLHSLKRSPQNVKGFLLLLTRKGRIETCGNSKENNEITT